MHWHTPTHTDRPLSISASSDGHQCYRRQYHLRFTFCLKTILQLLLKTLRPKKNPPTQQTGRRLLNSWWYSMTFQGRCVCVGVFFFFEIVAYILLKYTNAQMGFQAQCVTRTIINIDWYGECDVTTCGVWIPMDKKKTFHFKDVCQKEMQWIFGKLSVDTRTPKGLNGLSEG